ncbi:MAG: SDR family NAD(P)-dependent oxidoreductase [Gammaproteobacteria bacterium]|nr:SDR family NAD(P)-dependent oxidoreductase [Gammaproteobacteria bacterium]
MAKKVCLVTGVGPGTGAAIVRRFSKSYRIAMIARNENRLNQLKSDIDNAHSYPCDLGDLSSLENTFHRIVKDIGSPDVLIHNAVLGGFGPFQELSVGQIESAFRVNVSAFLRLAQLASPKMVESSRGAIVCTGNTAAYRGVPNFAGFAPTKAAQRILAESIARTLSPLGVHVAYVAIDAVIAVPWTRKSMPDKPEDFFSQPSDIADHIWTVVHQPKSAWTFDSVIRPYGENW